MDDVIGDTTEVIAGTSSSSYSRTLGAVLSVFPGENVFLNTFVKLYRECN